MIALQIEIIAHLIDSKVLAMRPFAIDQLLLLLEPIGLEGVAKSSIFFVL
jgi:hypothetical protein